MINIVNKTTSISELKAGISINYLIISILNKIKLSLNDNKLNKYK